MNHEGVLVVHDISFRHDIIWKDLISVVSNIQGTERLLCRRTEEEKMSQIDSSNIVISYQRISMEEDLQSKVD